MVVPNLTKKCIVGVDILRSVGGIINLRNDLLTVHDSGRPQTINVVKENSELKARGISHITEKVDQEGQETFNDMISNKVLNNRLISPQEKLIYRDMMHKYRTVFSAQPGRISCYHHKLYLEENANFCAKTYPTPICFEKQLDKQIKEMLEDGIISRSNSPHINPWSYRRRTVKLCLDARNLKEILLDDHEGIENMEVLFNKSKYKKIFSRLDINMSFWQIPLHPDSKIYKFTN